MNEILKRQWDFILEEALRLGMPAENKRGIIREFLQTKILNYIFKQKESVHISFMGGTCLRIVYGLNRFSEDLDFDLFGSPDLMVSLTEHAGHSLISEGYIIKLQTGAAGNTVNIKFPGLPFLMGFSPHEDENLQIKVDWDIREKVFEPEVFLLSRFGIIQRITVNPESVILAEKIAAVLYRKRAIPRDFFDLMYLLARNIRPDKKVLKSLDIKTDSLPDQIDSRFRELNMRQLENELKPFLFENTEFTRFDFFKELVIEKLSAF